MTISTRNSGSIHQFARYGPIPAGPGSGNPSRSAVMSSVPGTFSGGGVRDSPVASAIVAVITRISTVPRRRNGRRPVPSRSAGIVDRRCRHPSTPSAASATPFATTSIPYRDPRWTPPSRTHAFTAPLTPTTANATSASELYRSTTRRNPRPSREEECPSREECPAPWGSPSRTSGATVTRATSPPTHSATPSTWAARL
ncbi:Uncharacterised protein [Mycobacterium tuberculosis]|nr:Uncharacterised protein [Mycobacterium tuberculosis]